MENHATIPSASVEVQCADCRETATGSDLKEDVIRFFNPADKTAISLPKNLTPEQVDRLKYLELYCEVCWDDIQEKEND